MNKKKWKFLTLEKPASFMQYLVQGGIPGQREEA